MALSSNAVMGPEELVELVGQKVGLVGEISKVTARARRDGKPFVIATLELLGGGIEVVAWPNVYEHDRDIWKEGSLLLVEGKVKDRDNGITVYADSAMIYKEPHISESTRDQGPETPKDPPVDAKEEYHNSTHRLSKLPEGESLRTVLINLADTGDTPADALRLKTALQFLLEYPGTDRVLVEITSQGGRVRLEMPLITTRFCPELEGRLNDLIGSGRALLL